MNMREPQSLTHMEWEKHMKYKIKGFIWRGVRSIIDDDFYLAKFSTQQMVLVPSIWKGNC